MWAKGQDHTIFHSINVERGLTTWIGRELPEKRETKDYKPGNIATTKINCFIRVHGFRFVHETQPVNSMVAFPGFSPCQCLLSRRSETV